jgi:hypothetical protein
MIATVHSTTDLLTLVGWLIVIGCVIAAAVAAWQARWVAALVLLAVALVAGALLL